jgi:hypothetical protein
MTQKLIFMASPFRGDHAANIEFAKKCCKYVLGRGHNVYAAHLFYTQFLDDNDDAARLLGITLGMNMLEHCDEFWMFTKQGEHRTPGMEAERIKASELGLPEKSFKVSEDGIFSLSWSAR